MNTATSKREKKWWDRRHANHLKKRVVRLDFDTYDVVEVFDSVADACESSGASRYLMRKALNFGGEIDGSYWDWAQEID